MLVHQLNVDQRAKAFFLTRPAIWDVLVGGRLAVPSLTFYINLAQTFMSSQPYHIGEGPISIICEAVKDVLIKEPQQ